MGPCSLLLSKEDNVFEDVFGKCRGPNFIVNRVLLYLVWFLFSFFPTRRFQHSVLVEIVGFLI